MKQIGKIDTPNVNGFYLSDGDLNLAVLKFYGYTLAGTPRNIRGAIP